MTELILPPLEEKPHEPNDTDAVFPFPVTAECNMRLLFLARQAKLAIPRGGFQVELSKREIKFIKRHDDRHDWLDYENETRKSYYFPYRMFSSKKNIWNDSGFSNWDNFKKRCEKHEKSDSNLVSVDLFLKKYKGRGSFRF